MLGFMICKKKNTKEGSRQHGFVKIGVEVCYLLFVVCKETQILLYIVQEYSRPAVARLCDKIMWTEWPSTHQLDLCFDHWYQPSKIGGFEPWIHPQVLWYSYSKDF